MPEEGLLRGQFKFKLVSGLVDREIKEDFQGAEDKSLVDTVKAIEAKESAKRAKGKLVGRKRDVSRVETKSCRGTDHAFISEGFQKYPAKDKVCQKCGIQGYYTYTERCKNPRAVPSCVRRPKYPRKSADASFSSVSALVGSTSGPPNLPLP